MVSSRYDDLHDQYYQLRSSKKGTRYERLTAVVFKKLDTEAAVIHDLKLIGDSQVPHQIDVTIERQGTKMRILVECKDFDVSRKKVKLGIVRNFSAAVQDIKPDEAYIVTCNGFTRYARKFARASGIKMAILRTFEDSDWKGRIRKIILNPVVTTFPSAVAIELATAEDEAKLHRDKQEAGLLRPWIWPDDPVYFVSPAGRSQAYDFIAEKTKLGVRSAAEPAEHGVDVTDLWLEVENRGPVKLTSLQISYEVRHVAETTEFGGDKIALLILKGVGTEDAVVWDDELKRFRVDKTGQVTTN